MNRARSPVALDSGPQMECGICWNVYDPASGDEVWQIAPGTPFSALPATFADWPRLTPGSIRRVDFAAGSFDFVASFATPIGELLSCSLFSPVLEFSDQDAARQTAHAARIAMTELGTLDALPEIDLAAGTDDSSGKVSRRDFLRRSWLAAG